MDPVYLPILTAVGILAGWLNVLAGGGSLLTVPAMVFLGLPGPVANGTNRIAIIAQNLTAVAAFRRNGLSDFRLSLTLALAASLGALAGAMIGVKLTGIWFNRVLALVMLAVMALMLSGAGKKTKAQKSDDREIAEPRNIVLGHVLMVGVGLWGGFIQIGVGFILMPVLARVMGFDLVRVNMHKVFIVLTYSLVALIVFASQVKLAWAAGLALALGNALGGWLGVHMAIRKGETLIRRVFLLALTVLIVKLLLFP